MISITSMCLSCLPAKTQSRIKVLEYLERLAWTITLVLVKTLSGFELTTIWMWVSSYKPIDQGSDRLCPRYMELISFNEDGCGQSYKSPYDHNLRPRALLARKLLTFDSRIVIYDHRGSKRLAIDLLGTYLGHWSRQRPCQGCRPPIPDSCRRCRPRGTESHSCKGFSMMFF